MASPVGELFVKLFCKTEVLPLKEFISLLGNLDVRSVMAAFGLGELYEKMKQITLEATEAARELKLLNIETGIPTDQLNQWQNLAERIGIGKNSVVEAIKRLQMATGMSNVVPLLDKLHEAMKGMTPVAQKYMLAAYGLADIQAVLAASDEEYYGRLKDKNTMTGEQTKTLDKLRQSFETYGQTVTKVFRDIVTQYAPELEQFVVRLTALLDVSKPAIAVSFDALLKTTEAILYGWQQIFELFQGKKEFRPEFMEEYMQALKKGTNVGLYGPMAGAGLAANNISVIVHGASGGAFDVAQAVAHELKKLFSNTDKQSQVRK